VATINSREGKIVRADIDTSDEETGFGSPSLALTALGIGLEGQKYDQEGLSEAVERVKYEAPEVLAPVGGAERIKDVVRWLQDEM
ncbi:hypothetical protein BG004_008341, partial [Podila humilis]